MDELKLLDVTLRDGGYQNNFDFNEADLAEILSVLDSSGIDYIELGYRNGCLNYTDSIGPAGFCKRPYLEYCYDRVQTSKLAVMAHCDYITKDDLKELSQCSVHLLRLCAKKGEHDKVYNVIELANEYGLQVSVNYMYITQYSHDELLSSLDTMCAYQPEMIYFADSNGCLRPKEVLAIYQSCMERFNVPFGFHPHNNLGLAQANALAAYDAGVRLIDASLAGLGKGLGNLKLEFFVAFLKSIHIQKYDLKSIATLSNYVRTKLQHNRPIPTQEFIRGLLDLSSKELVEHLKTKENFT